MYQLIRTMARVFGGIIAGTAVLTAGPTFAAESNPQPSMTQSEMTTLAAKVARLEAVVADFEEHKKITDVYLRYGRGIDRLDEQSYRSAFWPDAQINYGTTESITADEHWANHMQKGFKESGKAWGHLLTNLAVDINGDVAHVEAYLTVFLVPKDSSAGTNTIFGGRYIDRLDRRNGEWRIAVREYLPHFAMKGDTTVYDWWQSAMSYKPESDCAKDHWGKRDTSYVRPLNRRRSKEDGPPCAK